MLARTGARVSEARSGARSAAESRGDRPDILLADVAMPGQDGYALMRAMRGLAAGEAGIPRHRRVGLRAA